MDESRKAAKLDDAINRAEFDEVKALLDAGYDPNLRDVVGDTMLINAAWVGAVAIVKLLIEHGADVNARGQDGKTALGRLLEIEDLDEYGHNDEYDHRRVIEVLRSHGASE